MKLLLVSTVAPITFQLLFLFPPFNRICSSILKGNLKFKVTLYIVSGLTMYIHAVSILLFLISSFGSVQISPLLYDCIKQILVSIPISRRKLQS